MKVKNYSIEDIFQKKLLFLIPFYIFSFEADFRKIDEDSAHLKALEAEYRQIAQRLENLVEAGELDQYDKKAIMEMSERVIENLAQNYRNIVKGVVSIMSGQILDYEAKDIRNKALAEGIAEGRAEGRAEGAFDTLVSLVNGGLLSLKDAAAHAGITESSFKKQMAGK